MSFLVARQSNTSNTPGQSKWVFEKLVSSHGYSNISPRVLIVGDDGTQALDVISVFPSYSSIDIVEINSDCRSTAVTNLSAYDNINVVEPALHTFHSTSYDLVICIFVLCRFPEHGAGPIAYVDFQGAVDTLFETLDQNGVLITIGSNYSVEDYQPDQSQLVQMCAYPSHVPTYEPDGVTVKANNSGSFVLIRTEVNPVPKEYTGYFNATATRDGGSSGVLLSGNSAPFITYLLNALNITNHVNGQAILLSFNNGANTILFPIGVTYNTLPSSTSVTFNTNSGDLLLTAGTSLVPGLTYFNIANATSVVVTYV